MDDRDADFAEYVGERSAALRRYAYLLTGDLASADDLLQDAPAADVMAGVADRDEVWRLLVALGRGDEHRRDGPAAQRRERSDRVVTAASSVMVTSVVAS